MEDKRPIKITTDIPLSLHKAFQHKLIDEGLTVKEVVRQLIDLWVKGEITLPLQLKETKKEGSR